MENVPPLALEHAEGFEHIPFDSFFEDTDVHQTVVHRSTRCQRKHRAPRLTVLNQKKREIIGDESIVKRQRRRPSTSSEDGQQNSDIVGTGPIHRIFSAWMVESTPSPHVTKL